jgi:hypothetical protein
MASRITIDNPDKVRDVVVIGTIDQNVIKESYYLKKIPFRFYTLTMYWTKIIVG